jgi:hypothetical protein
MSANGRASRYTAADLFDGLSTLGVLVLTFLAFDDITTDHSASFRAEYTALLACAAWGAVLIVRLVWRRRMALAGVCAVLLLAVLWGQQSIGPGTRASLEQGYLVASAAFLGLLIVAIYLVIRGAGRTTDTSSIRSIVTSPRRGASATSTGSRGAVEPH